MISFIIPTLNEKGNIDTTISKIVSCFENVEDFEIIFVDDKSTDGTLNEINNSINQYKNIKLIISGKKMGLGNALLLGQKSSSGNFVFFLDCDNSILTHDIKKIISLKNEQKVIIGSRYIKNSKIYGVNKIKLFLSRTLNFIVSRYLGIKAIDISHSCRLFPKQLLFECKNLHHPIFFWEHSYLSTLNGFEILETSISFYERSDGATKNNLFKLFKIVLKNIFVVIKLKNKNKKYI